MCCYAVLDSVRSNAGDSIQVAAYGFLDMAYEEDYFATKHYASDGIRCMWKRDRPLVYFNICTDYVLCSTPYSTRIGTVS